MGVQYHKVESSEHLQISLWRGISSNVTYTTFFVTIELESFNDFYIGPPLTPFYYLPLIIWHIDNCEICCDSRLIGATSDLEDHNCQINVK